MSFEATPVRGDRIIDAARQVAQAEMSEVLLGGPTWPFVEPYQVRDGRYVISVMVYPRGKVLDVPPVGKKAMRGIIRQLAEPWDRMWLQSPSDVFERYLRESGVDVWSRQAVGSRELQSGPKSWRKSR